MSAALLSVLVLGGLGLGLRLSVNHPQARAVGGAIALLALVVLGFMLPALGDWLSQSVFWLLAGITVVAAGMAITAQYPVYMALWFALSLLGTAGLFLYQGAQFLGVATIAVYAGAIVVTFLFVIMLAQPRGSATYDRISWAVFAAPLAVLAGAVLLGFLLTPLNADLDPSTPRAGTVPRVADSEDHMARLGGELFARHLVSVEIAGTLLLVALVGAVVIILHGKNRAEKHAADEWLPGEVDYAGPAHPLPRETAE
jgi:NADH-quinone oxidoreductase subunit J